MYSLDYEDDPGWMSNFLTWTANLWARWTAPDPEKIPFDPATLKSRIERCLVRMKILRRQQDACVKQELPELVRLAKEEALEAEMKASAYLDRLKLFRVLDLLEPHLLLLKDSINLPTHDMSPMPSVRTLIYVAPEVPRIEELALIRQQLVQKYHSVIAVVKIDLVDQDVVDLLQTHTTRITVLKWLNEQAPNRGWAGKLQEALQTDFRHPNPQESPQTTQEMDEDALFTAEGTQETVQNAPDFSDDDDGDGGGFNEGILGRSNDSGPTDSPIPPLESREFPSVPETRLYPVLSLSDSLEAPAKNPSVTQ